MKSASELHTDQIEFWNGQTGSQWVDDQQRIDTLLAQVLDAALSVARAKPGESVLDIGCGTGASSIALAKLVAPPDSKTNGRVVGLDVSQPMVEWARKRSASHPNIDYIVADATTHRFPAPFADLLFSRFGVMFFGDPTAAFTNLRRALKPGGRMAFACWRKIDENPWMQVPLHAAYEHVARLPKPGPEDPGPISFADPERVTRILTAAGFAKPRFTPKEFMFDIAGGRGMDDAVNQAMTIGPASRAIKDQPDDVVAKVRESIRAALAPYAKGSAVALPGAIWLVEG